MKMDDSGWKQSADISSIEQQFLQDMMLDHIDLIDSRVVYK